MRAKKAVKTYAKIYKKKDDVIYRSRASENMIIKTNYKLGEDAVFILNNTSAFIWNAINGKRDIDKISELVARNFDVTEKEAVCDVSKVLRELERFCLIYR